MSQVQGAAGAGPARRSGPSADAAARLRRRYPEPRLPRPVLISLVGVAAILALTWLISTALRLSTPAVSAQVPWYAVASDTRIDVTMTVERRNPRLPVTCRLVAQAVDFEPVAEQQVHVPASTARIVDTHLSLTTLRRATTASVKGCTVD